MERFSDIGFAKLDVGRASRTGFGETIYCPGKTTEQIVSILRLFKEKGLPVLGTKCSAGQAASLADHELPVTYEPVSRIFVSDWGKPSPLGGRVAVCTGGTADMPIAEEVAHSLEFFGVRVDRHLDIGVAGLARLLGKIDDIREADIVVAVAGMEGALGSVIAGLVPSPVIAVPTSVGYGASFGGLAPLLSMLNSCAEGMAVVNIDNGFGAAMLACRMIRRMHAKEVGNV